MSTNTQTAYEKLIQRLQPLSWKQRIHTVNRLYEKIRLVHNAVGDVYAKRATIQDFQTNYPTISQKLAPIMSQHIVNNHLTEMGWRVFQDNIFNPRHNAICKIRSQLVAQIKNLTPTQISTLIAEGIIEESSMPDETISYHDKKVSLRETVAEHDLDFDYEPRIEPDEE